MSCIHLVYPGGFSETTRLRNVAQYKCNAEICCVHRVWQLQEGSERMQRSTQCDNQSNTFDLASDPASINGIGQLCHRSMY